MSRISANFDPDKNHVFDFTTNPLDPKEQVEQVNQEEAEDYASSNMSPLRHKNSQARPDSNVHLVSV